MVHSPCTLAAYIFNPSLCNAFLLAGSPPDMDRSGMTSMAPQGRDQLTEQVGFSKVEGSETDGRMFQC